MHQPIRERLEQYLGGMVDREVDLHLAQCPLCRDEVERMRRHAAVLRSLRPGEEELEPAPGFYARVMERIESQRTTSVWSILLEPVFAKRLAYASLALLAVLGALAVSIGTEPAPGPAPSAEVIMVENPIGPPLGADPARDRNVVLVNLATYQH